MLRRTSSLITGVLILALLAQPASIAGAQPFTQAEPPVIDVLLSTTVDQLPDGPSMLRASRMVLKGGARTENIVADGPVLVLVQTGTLTVFGGAGIVGPRGESVLDDVPFFITKGQQAYLPSGVEARLANTGCRPLKLLIFSVEPIDQTVGLLSVPTGTLSGLSQSDRSS